MSMLDFTEVAALAPARQCDRRTDGPPLFQSDVPTTPEKGYADADADRGQEAQGNGRQEAGGQAAAG